MTGKRNHSEFVELIKHHPITVIGKYKTAHAKIAFKCEVDGHVWITSPNSVLRGTGCPICGARKASLSGRKTNTRFIEELNGRGITPTEAYKGDAIRIKFRCDIDGFEWATSPSSVLQGSGCPRCAGSETITEDIFLERIKSRGIELLTPFIGRKIPVKLKCKVEGHVWHSAPSNILSGKGCPECGKKSSADKRRKRNSVIEIHEDWMLIDTSTPQHQNTTSKMNKDAFDLIQNKIWIDAHGYPTFTMSGKNIKVHRFIHPEWTETDHANRDKTDNRRCNLRECTHQENNRNRSISSSNKSGTTGVSWEKARKAWYASIRVGGRTKSLGIHKEKSDAITARLAAEQKYFGEFAPITRGA